LLAFHTLDSGFRRNDAKKRFREADEDYVIHLDPWWNPVIDD